MTPAAELIADQVRSVKGAVDVGLSTKGQKPELSVDINRGLAGSLGVTVAQVAQSLRPAFAGIKAGDWVDPSDETREVNVRLAPEARRRAADLEQLPIVVMGSDGRPRTLPLGQIATISQSLGPAQISHLDSDPVVTVQANTSGRPLTEVMTTALENDGVEPELSIIVAELCLHPRARQVQHPPNVRRRDEVPRWPEYVGAQNRAVGNLLFDVRIACTAAQTLRERPFGALVILSLYSSEQLHDFACLPKTLLDEMLTR